MMELFSLKSMSIYDSIDILMQKISIGTKNQIVIPKEIRGKISGLKPGRKVLVYAVNSNTVAIKVDDSSWLENGFGKMSAAWKKIDPVLAVKDLRKEWGDE